MADWIAIEGEYRAGVRTLRDIASEHGVSEGGIRKRAKKFGWTRDPAGTQRQLVRANLVGAGTQVSTQDVLRTMEQSAEEASSDMRLGLAVARALLTRLWEMLDAVTEPRDIKTLSEANQINIETIRRIRELDEPAAKQPDQRAVMVDVMTALRDAYGA